MEGGDLYNFMKKKGNTPLESAFTEDESRHVIQQVL
jgi:hypothetical protein